jgi:hypothetical protein
MYGTMLSTRVGELIVSTIRLLGPLSGHLETAQDSKPMIMMALD